MVVNLRYAFYCVHRVGSSLVLDYYAGNCDRHCAQWICGSLHAISACIGALELARWIIADLNRVSLGFSVASKALVVLASSFRSFAYVGNDSWHLRWWCQFRHADDQLFHSTRSALKYRQARFHQRFAFPGMNRESPRSLMALHASLGSWAPSPYSPLSLQNSWVLRIAFESVDCYDCGYLVSACQTILSSSRAWP